LRERVGTDLPVLMLFDIPPSVSLAGFLRADKKEEPFAQEFTSARQRQKSRGDRSQPLAHRVKL